MSCRTKSNLVSAFVVVLATGLSTAVCFAQDEDPKEIFESLSRGETIYRTTSNPPELPPQAVALLRQQHLNPLEFQVKNAGFDYCPRCGWAVEFSGLVKYYISSRTLACQLAVKATDAQIRDYLWRERVPREPILPPKITCLRR